MQSFYFQNLEKNNSIDYKVDSFKNVTGYNLAEEKQINYLEKLGFEINKEKSFFSIIAPSWRHDIFDTNDIIEEMIAQNRNPKKKKYQENTNASDKYTK